MPDLNEEVSTVDGGETKKRRAVRRPRKSADNSAKLLVIVELETTLANVEAVTDGLAALGTPRSIKIKEAK